MDKEKRKLVDKREFYQMWRAIRHKIPAPQRTIITAILYQNLFVKVGEKIGKDTEDKEDSKFRYENKNIVLTFD